ncbi:MAG TPA: ketosteroid isomerase-related protein [Luteolibacter sp.]|nr:ketosteroid isomerase-related protein [Luteolibacter sp.]
MQSLIKRYYDTFNSGDREALLAMLAEDVVHEINEGAAEVGRDAFRAFLQRMDRCYREQVEDLVVFTSDQPNRAAAEFFIRGQYIATDEGLPEAAGQSYHLRIGAFFEGREGRIRRITNYYNLAAWMAQVR